MNHIQIKVHLIQQHHYLIRGYFDIFHEDFRLIFVHHYMFHRMLFVCRLFHRRIEEDARRKDN
jgi:hypothetical protein